MFFWGGPCSLKVLPCTCLRGNLSDSPLTQDTGDTSGGQVFLTQRAPSTPTQGTPMALKCIFAPLTLKLSAILALGIPAMFGQDAALCASHRAGFYRPHRTSATHRANVDKTTDGEYQASHPSAQFDTAAYHASSSSASAAACRENSHSAFILSGSGI